MAVMDEFKEERQALKEKSFKEKLSYFWLYYKWHVIITVAVIVLGGTLIKEMVTSKDFALYGVFLNAYNKVENVTPFTDEFIEYAGIDTNEFSVQFDNTLRMSQEFDEAGMHASQLIMVHIAAQDLDVATMDTFNFNKYAYNSTFLDLREVLTPEELEYFQDDLFYIDSEVVKEVERISEEMITDYEITYPAYDDPASMTDPIPVGINLKDSEKFKEYYTYGKAEAFFGIVTNTHNTENALALLHYLFEE